jgi:hypothetical protein
MVGVQSNEIKIGLPYDVAGSNAHAINHLSWEVQRQAGIQTSLFPIK